MYSKKAALALVALFLALLAIPWAPRVQGTQGGAISSAYTTSPPTIDGSLGAGEWANQRTITLDLYPDGSRSKQADLYLVNDAANLYVALSLQSTEAASLERYPKFRSFTIRMGFSQT